MVKRNHPEFPIRRKLGITMAETYQYVYDKSQEFFWKYDLTSQQYNVLIILHESSHPLSTSDILKRMVEKNAGVSRLVDRLIVKGLVEKNTNTYDKRLIDIQLTTKGEMLCREVTDHLSDVDKVFDSLTEKEAELLIHLLSKLKNE